MQHRVHAQVVLVSRVVYLDLSLLQEMRIAITEQSTDLNHVHCQQSCCRSRAHTTAIYRKPCFLGRHCVPTTASVLGPCLAYGVCSCGVGDRQESGQLHGCRGAVHGIQMGVVR